MHVSVFRLPEMDTKCRVTDSGEISLPLIGRLKVLGLTPPEAAAAIEQAYASRQFVMHPQVSVFVEEYATQSVSVLGEVEHPGTFPLITAHSVMDVLALAGGLTPAADRHITIQHRTPSRGGHDQAAKEEVFLPNNSSTALSDERAVYPGDIVLVPKAGVVYVLGDVGRPGGYIMQDDSTLTVLQAVAMAAGTNRTAAEGRARLIRRSASGFVEMPLPLRDMQKGKAPDIALQHDDILWVPFSYGKNFAVSGATIVGSAGSAAVYRF